MKNIITFLFFVFGTIYYAQAEPLVSSIQVYDSQTNTISNLPIDTTLTELDGQPLEKDPNKPVPAVIIGKEDWFQWTQWSFPASATVYLEESNGGSCSGAMIGDYTVLTAAHCVYKDVTTKKGILKNPANITAYIGGKNSSIHAKGTRIIAAAGTQSRTWGEDFIQRDYAIIVLNKPVGKRSGTFGATKANFTKGEKIYIMGFPGKLNKKFPWLSHGNVTTVGKGFIKHTADILPGSSGGPVFFSGKYQIVGVTSFENSTEKINGAVTSENTGLLSFIKQYRNTTPNMRAEAVSPEQDTPSPAIVKEKIRKNVQKLRHNSNTTLP